MDEQLRCRATSKSRGERCRKAAMRGGFVCRSHGGAAPQVKAAAAKRWAEQLVPAAVRRVRDLIEQPDSPPPVAFAASRFVLETEYGRATERQEVKHSGTTVYRWLREGEEAPE